MLVNEVLSKVSEKLSRISVLHTLVRHLETHYVGLDSGAGDPEQYITRSDHGVVPQEHIQVEIARLQEEIASLQAEIHEWNSLLVVSKDDLKALAADNKPKPKRKRTRAPRNKNQHPAASSKPS